MLRRRAPGHFQALWRNNDIILGNLMAGLHRSHVATSLNLLKLLLIKNNPTTDFVILRSPGPPGSFWIYFIFWKIHGSKKGMMVICDIADFPGLNGCVIIHWAAGTAEFPQLQKRCRSLLPPSVRPPSRQVQLGSFRSPVWARIQIIAVNN